MKMPMIGTISTALAVVALSFAVWFVHRENVGLRRQLAVRTQPAATPGPAAVIEPEPAHVLVAAAPSQIHTELLLTRQRLADAEKLTFEKRAKYLAQQAKDAEMLATNHDAQKGLARIENLQNRGQATPSAALQTLLWATFKGDETTMGSVLTISDDDRARVNTLISQLPPESQAQWTPAKIAALYLTSRVNDMAAVEITEERSLDAQHTAVALRFPGYNKHVDIVMTLGPGGWQLVLPNVGRVAEMYLRGNG